MAIIPIIVFIFFAAGFYRLKSLSLNRREAFLVAAVVWAIVLVFLTEILSAYQLFSFPYLTGSWMLAAVLGFVFGVFKVRNIQVKFASFNVKYSIACSFSGMGMFDKVMLGLMGLVFVLVGLTALIAPPNNWDSLVYHMGRVSHWIQNKTIAHYPTNIKTQIYYPPFAEWVIAHFQILSGTDRLANGVQWLAMVGSAVAASLVARFYGAVLRGQIFAALLSVTIPMGIVQGSSTQNDYVLSFWLIVFVYFALRLKSGGKRLDVFVGGAALGLACLTKALALIFALPMMIWLFCSGWKHNRAQLFKNFILIAFLVGLLNINHLYRNFVICGNILGEPQVFSMTRNTRMSPALFVSNVVRNAGLHLATSLKPLNRWSEQRIEDFHQLINVNSADSATTLGADPLRISVSTHEDVAGNFFQLSLIILAMSIIFWRREIVPRDLKNYVFAVLGMVVLFNILLKWQPAASRLHLPIFVLLMPVVAVVLTNYLNKSREIILVVVVGLLVSTSTPYVLRNSTRKLFSSKSTIFSTPRLQQYFADDDTLLPAYQSTVDWVAQKNCREVGLRIGDNSWEYPLAVLFHRSSRGPFRLEHVDVDTRHSKPMDYPLGEFHPCAIIETGRTNPLGKNLNIDGKVFFKQLEQAPLGVYFVSD
ncbi:MAG: glycosyltransferase family 39 protein [Candidatus Omnitrophica bacterium]|nr:glycosyltransferase family 39 protein [Candidatus Omnitrophota bacterium]